MDSQRDDPVNEINTNNNGDHIILTMNQWVYVLREIGFSRHFLYLC
jgi:hypothetical protein